MINESDEEIAELRVRLAKLESEKVAAPTGTQEARAVPQSHSVDKRNGILVVFIGAIVLLIGVIVILNRTSGALSNASSGEINVPASIFTPGALAASSNASLISSSSWSYSDQTDKMRGRSSHFACTNSTNQVALDFPYHATGAELCVRRSSKGGVDIYVQLHGNGQILCGLTDGCSVPVGFGNGRLAHVRGTEPADHSTTMLFLGSEASLITRMKTAETTSVELRFYQAGDQQLYFHTKGLEWTQAKKATETRPLPNSE